MVDLLEMVKFQILEHLFEGPSPMLHEKDVRMFYHNLVFSYDALYLPYQVNKVNIALDEQVLSKILGVPRKDTRSLVDEKGSEKFLEV